MLVFAAAFASTLTSTSTSALLFVYCIACIVFGMKLTKLLHLGANHFSASFAKQAKASICPYFSYAFIAFRVAAFRLLDAGDAMVLRLAATILSSMCHSNLSNVMSTEAYKHYKNAMPSTNLFVISGTANKAF